MKHPFKTTALAFLLGLGFAAPAPAQDASQYVSSGDEKQALKNPGGAIDDYNHAIALDPKNEQAYVRRATAKQAKGDLDGAIADFTRALELDPKDTNAGLLRGYARHAKGDQPGALADMTRLIEANPGQPDYYISRGSVKQDNGDLDSALADYTHAIEADPNYGTPYSARANLEMLMRNWKAALADYRSSCAAPDPGRLLTPDDPQLYIWLLRARMGDTAAAGKDLSAYLARRLGDTDNAFTDDWITSAGNYFAGNVSENSLFAAAASGKYMSPAVMAATTYSRTSEAAYFAGVKHLFDGDKKAAAAYFRRCMDREKKGILYKLAESELKALGG